MSNLFEVKKLSKSFYRFKVLRNVSFELGESEIVGLIGPNGSGKTTLFNCVTGIHDPDSGYVKFKGRDITGHAMHEISKFGIGRTFQQGYIFPSLSVLENLYLAVQHHQAGSILAASLQFWKIQDWEKEARDRAQELLSLMGISHMGHEPAANLSYGQRKLLSISIALAGNPELMLLDEPTSAVNPSIIRDIVSYIHELRNKGIAFLIIEHNMEVAMELSDRIVVLAHAEKIAEGTPKEIRDNPKVMEAYLGEE